MNWESRKEYQQTNNNNMTPNFALCTLALLHLLSWTMWTCYFSWRPHTVSGASDRLPPWGSCYCWKVVFVCYFFWGCADDQSPRGYIRHRVWFLAEAALTLWDSHERKRAGPQYVIKYSLISVMQVVLSRSDILIQTRCTRYRVPGSACITQTRQLRLYIWGFTSREHVFTKADELHLGSDDHIFREGRECERVCHFISRKAARALMIPIAARALSAPLTRMFLLILLSHSLSPRDISEMLPCENTTSCMVSHHEWSLVTHAGTLDHFPLHPGKRESVKKKLMRLINWNQLREMSAWPLEGKSCE